MSERKSKKQTLFCVSQDASEEPRMHSGLLGEMKACVAKRWSEEEKTSGDSEKASIMD